MIKLTILLPLLFIATWQQWDQWSMNQKHIYTGMHSFTKANWASTALPSRQSRSTL